MKTKAYKTKEKGRIMLFLCFLFIASYILPTATCFSQIQGAAINTNGATADPSAILDVNSTANPSQGMLIPRLTTAQRTTITAPAQFLMICNTTTKCFETYANGFWQSIWCACTPAAVSVSIAAVPSGAICSGTNVTFTATPTNGGASPAYQWYKGGSIISGATNATYFYAPAAGDIITCVLTSNAPCATGSPYTSSGITETVNAPSTTSVAGSDINACGVSTATLAGNTAIVGSGAWSLISGTATITTPGSPTSGVTGLAIPGTATLRWTISNSPCPASTDDIIITTTTCFPCGSTLTDSRDSKTYSTVLIGSQCWMKQNLNYGTYVPVATGGQTNNSIPEKYCTNTAGTGNDNTCPYGGLYDFAEAVQYLNGVTNTTSWNPVPTGNVQGVCPTGWHIPKDAEWCTMENTVEAATDASCNLTGWRGITTGDKMKTAGNGSPPLWASPSTGTNSSGFTALPGGISSSGSFLNAGFIGYWWSATEFSPTDAWYRYLVYSFATVCRSCSSETYGFSVRCIKD